MGLLCTSFVPQNAPWLLYVTFSFMQGVGNGLTYTVATYVSTSWFPDRRGLAAGLCMACNGGASAFLAPICAKLTEATSIIVTLRTVGIAALVVVLVCGMFVEYAPAGYMPAGFKPCAPHAPDLAPGCLHRVLPDDVHDHVPPLLGHDAGCRL